MKKKTYIGFFPKYYNQTADREAKIEKYFCNKIIILFLIYFGFY